MHLNNKSYCIKNDYKINASKSTIDVGDHVYWNDDRIRASHFYQYHVYILARNIVKTKSINNVLDVGCGPATKLMELVFPHCANVVGIDQPSTIEICKKRYKDGEFYTDNFESPKLKLNKEFDLIICCDVIEHLLNPDILLNYIKGFSHNSSLIIFSTPERDLLRGPDCMASEKPDHVREWNQSEFRRYLESRGFKIIQTLLVPGMRFHCSREYLQFLKRVLNRKHEFKTCQIVVAMIN